MWLRRPPDDPANPARKPEVETVFGLGFVWFVGLFFNQPNSMCSSFKTFHSSFRRTACMP